MRHLTLLALLVACSGGSTKDTSETGDTEVDCSDVDLVVPSPRGEASGVWDGERDRLVFFGGDIGRPVDCFPQTSFVDETWAFHTDCNNFVQIEGDAPPARGRHATTLDGQGRMVIHGGRYRDGTEGTYTLRGDTWAFDLATDTWSEVATDGPSARTNHVMVTAGDRVLLFGGNSSTSGASFIPHDDLWALDAGAWSELSPVNSGPSARLFHAATASDDGKTMYVYGGGDENAFFGPFFEDLWALDVETLEWTELHAGGSGAPDGRIWPDLLFDGANDRLILWAGHDDGQLGNTNELWTFDLSSKEWSRLQQGDVLENGAAGFCDFPADFVDPDLDAPERRNAAVSALTDEGHLVTFGGKTDCGIINDAWSYDFDSSSWTSRSRATEGEICLRAYQDCETMCY